MEWYSKLLWFRTSFNVGISQLDGFVSAAFGVGAAVATICFPLVRAVAQVSGTYSDMKSHTLAFS